MIRTNVVDKNNPHGHADNKETAKTDIPNLLFPKTGISLIHAGQHEEYAEVAYLEGMEVKHAKIQMDKLLDFAIGKWRDEDKPGDVTVYHFIDENLFKVIEAYIAARKETSPL